jgi:hypothetical protein
VSIEAAEQAVSAARRGDLTPVAPALAALDSIGDPAARAWLLALRALVASFDPDRAEAPRPEEVDDLPLGDPAICHAVAVTCARMVRLRVLALDAAALVPWIERLQRIECADPTRLRGAAAAARLWHALLGLEPAALGADADALLAAAGGEPSSSAAIEATALRALVAAAAGGSAAALEHATRASRAAEGTGRPEDQYITSLVLARLQRRHGRPQAAHTILRALGRNAAPAWLPCIACELILAGGEPEARVLVDRFPLALAAAPSARVARAALGLLSAARAGDRAAFTTARDQLDAALPAGPVLGADGRALASLLDPTTEAGSPLIAEWRTGQRDHIPLGLDGGGVRPGVFVHAAPGGPAARLLRAGLPLAGVPAQPEGDAAAETGLALLALAGPEGLDRNRFFAAVHGTDYAHSQHEASLEALVANMAARLDGTGRVDRPAHGLTLALALERPMAVPDRRCVPAVAERVLRVVAALGSTDAEGAALPLGLPVDVVDRALEQLVAEGACRTCGEGRPRYELHEPAIAPVRLGPPA